MSEFYVNKVIYVAHSDGWRHKIYIKDEAICITYEENNGVGEWVPKESVTGIWKDAAKLMATALLEMSQLEGLA